MKPTLQIGWTIVPALFLSACGAGTQPDDAGWSTTVDTVGGVVHVVHAPRSSEPAVTRVAEEEWRIGTVDGAGPTSFGMIRSVAVLADGRFAVADAQGEEVRLTEPEADSTVYDVFERDGALAATVRMPFRVDRYVPPVVRGETAWVVVTDEMDVRHVVRARLRAVGGGG